MAAEWLSLEKGKIVVATFNYAVSIQTNGESLVQRAVVQPNDIDGWDKEEKAGCSLYLNELLIQKCKFRHRVTVNF